MNATGTTSPHLFARDKTHGIKHLFPFGDSAHKIPVASHADQIPWTRGEAQTFDCLHAGKREALFTARAFDNGNLHLKLNQRFILALNVEHGRLRGWLKTPQDAAEELRDPSAAKHFRTHLQLPIPESPLALL